MITLGSKHTIKNEGSTVHFNIYLATSAAKICEAFGLIIGTIYANELKGNHNDKKLNLYALVVKITTHTIIKFYCMRILASLTPFLIFVPLIS